MPANKNGDTPAAPSFNFDQYEHEIDGPFVVVIGGKQYESIDPVMLDFRELIKSMRSDDEEEQFKQLFPKDHAAILKNKIPLGALHAFTTAVEEHFGLRDFIDSPV